VTRQALFDNYGLQPFATSFLSNDSYYLHMLLEVGEQAALIYPSGEMTEADIRTSIESTLKRASPGFLKVVGIWQPTILPDPQMAQFGQTGPPPFSTWNTLVQQLNQEYEARTIDLSGGQVPADIDVLVVVGPQGMGDIELYAVDQMLMRGGSVVIAGSNYRVVPNPFSGELAVEPITDGVRDLLLHYGVDVQEALVLDPQNTGFPIMTTRQVGGFTVQEPQTLDYPYFVDVRSDGMSEESAVIANLPAVTLNWASPVIIDESKNAQREVTTLLASTETSWASDSLTIQPNQDLYPEYGFPVGEEQGSQPLAVSVIGAFDSYFAEKEVPQPELNPDPASQDPNAPPPAQLSGATITQSPEISRLVVIGSGDFLNDTVFEIVGQLPPFDAYLTSLQLVQNTVDWSVEDLDLLEIRTRGTYARLLEPLETGEQRMWEFANYGIALLALLGVGFFWLVRRRSETPMMLTPVE